MNFRIHNFKLKTWNNSCDFVFEMQLQWDTTSPIHLKNDTKQNKDKKNYNKNEYKQNTTNGENYLFMGTPIRLLQVETKIYHHGPSTMPQYSSWTFAITFKDLTNNHYKWLLQPNMTIVTIASRKNIVQCKVKNHTWKRDLWFKVLGIKKKTKTLNGWRCLDEKITNPCKSHMSSLGYQ